MLRMLAVVGCCSDSCPRWNIWMLFKFNLSTGVLAEEMPVNRHQGRTLNICSESRVSRTSGWQVTTSPSQGHELPPYPRKTGLTKSFSLRTSGVSDGAAKSRVQLLRIHVTIYQERQIRDKRMNMLIGLGPMVDQRIWIFAYVLPELFWAMSKAPPSPHAMPKMLYQIPSQMLKIRSILFCGDV